MRFSDLNINFNQQACSQIFSPKLEYLKNWGSYIIDTVQAHPYALDKHSPQAISGILLVINGLFFLSIQSLINSIEASLNKRFPNIPTIHLMISTTLLGGSIGALNLALCKLARLPVSVNLLYTISIASVALHLIFKPSTPSSAKPIPHPSLPLPPPISSKPNNPPEPPIPPTQLPPQPAIPQLPPPPESSKNEQPDQLPPQPFLIRHPPRKPPSSDLSTPMPSNPLLIKPHTPTFTPRKIATPPGTPPTIPLLNVKDLEDVEKKVLEEINQLELKKDNMNNFLTRYETLIQQFKDALREAHQKRSGSKARRLISSNIQQSEEGQKQAQSCLDDLNRELAEQQKLLESIRKQKLGAALSGHPSIRGTPEANFRQHLIKSTSSIRAKVSEPPLQGHASSLELNQSLNSPERKIEVLSQPLTTTTDPLDESFEMLPPDHPTLNFHIDDEQVDKVSDDDEQVDEVSDDENEFFDEEGNTYQQMIFPSGRCLLFDQDGNCFDLDGNFVGSLIEKTFER